jgi:hypothetical protein
VYAAPRGGSSGGAKSHDGDDDATTTLQPPACLGLEWLRYRDLVLEARAAAPVNVVPAVPTLPVTVSARASDGAAGGARTAGGTAANNTDVAPSSAQPTRTNNNSSTSNSSNNSSRSSNTSTSSGSWLDDALARARIVAQGIKDDHFDADADVLWFAKRFYRRAQINADAMGKTALQLLAAATGTLPPDDDAGD